MFGAKKTEGERRPVAAARGGLSFVAILTGVVVAFGALFLLSALVGGFFAASGIDPGGLANDANPREVGIGIGIGMVVAWFLACLWGGYTAGRMSRGAGFVNGILVPIVVLVLGVAVGAIVGALGETTSFNLPFQDSQLPPGNSVLYDLSAGFGIAVLVAMLVGGALGGALGSRWHTKLERRTVQDEERAVEQRGANRAENREEEERRARERAEAREREPATTTERTPTQR